MIQLHRRTIEGESTEQRCPIQQRHPKFSMPLINLTIIAFCGLSLAQRRKPVSAYMCVCICTYIHTCMFVCIHRYVHIKGHVKKCLYHFIAAIQPNAHQQKKGSMHCSTSIHSGLLHSNRTKLHLHAII